MTTKNIHGGSTIGLLTLLAIAGVQGCAGVEGDDELSDAEEERLELDEEFDSEGEEDDEDDEDEAPVDSQDDLDLVSDPGDDDGEAVINESTIYGVEFNSNAASVGPSKLFRYTVSDGSFATIADIKRNGANVRMDGLALASNGTLYGFVNETNASNQFTGTSTLVTIDTATGVTSTPGGSMANRKIVGAAFTWDGSTEQLWALDTTSNQILRVDPTTGAAIAGSAVSLTLNGVAFAFGDGGDVTQHQDGSLWINPNNSLYKVNTTTGALTNQANTNVSGTYGLTGAVFHPYLASSNVIAMDNNGTDELLQVQVTTATPGATSALLGGGLTTAEQGIGDLAAKSYASTNWTSAPLCLLVEGAWVYQDNAQLHTRLPAVGRLWYDTNLPGTYTVIPFGGSVYDGYASQYDYNGNDPGGCGVWPGCSASGVAIQRTFNGSSTNTVWRSIGETYYFEPGYLDLADWTWPGGPRRMTQLVGKCDAPIPLNSESGAYGDSNAGTFGYYYYHGEILQ